MVAVMKMLGFERIGVCTSKNTLERSRQSLVASIPLSLVFKSSASVYTFGGRMLSPMTSTVAVAYDLYRPADD